MPKCSHSKDFGGGGTSFKLLQRVSGFTKFLKTIKGESKKAFTLAEVLITLGIIGVVAALTIPNVTSLYRKKVVETRLAKFNSSINQAIRRAEVDYGPVKYWDTPYRVLDEDSGNYIANNMEWYEKYLKPYLKVLKVGDYSGVNGAVVIYFPDGSSSAFSGQDIAFYPESKTYDELEKNGFTLADRMKASGIKYFTFYFYPDYGSGGVFPYAQQNDLTLNTIKTNGWGGCKESVSNVRAYCTLWIARNGWKIPDDYPFKF